MSNEKKQGLAVIEESTALTVLTTGLDELIQGVKERVESDVSDISKKKGRDEVISNAFKVTKTKTYISGKIDDLITAKKAEIQPTLEIIEVLKGNKKKSNLELSKLAEDTRNVVTEWEAEQAAIKAELEAKEAAEKLAAEVASCEELAVFMNADFDRIAEEKAKAESARLAEEQRVAKQARIDEQKEIERLAAEKATREAEEAAKAALDKIEADKQAAIQLAEDEKSKAAQAERDKIAAQERAKIQADNAEKAKIAAEAKAKQDAIDAAENARLLEVKRQKDEAARVEADRIKRENNTKHKSKTMKAAKEGLMLSGIDEATAKKIVIAIKNGEVPNISIQF